MTDVRARPAETARPAEGTGAAAPGFFADTEVTGREHWLRLHLNENPYGPPPGTAEAVCDEAVSHLSLYPDSACRALRERLAEHFGIGTGMVALGNGTDELVLLTSLSFLADPSATVAVTANTFPGYLASASAVGAAVRTVPLRAGAVPADSVGGALRDGADLAFVCNPHNPTGSVLSRRAVTELVDAAEASGRILVLDEAYMEFAGPAYEFALEALRAGRRLIVLRTFSKAWGLASVRLGCALGPPDLVGRIERTASALPFNVSRPAQRAVLQALEQPGYVAGVREANERSRELLVKSLDALGLKSAPSASNFVMVEVPGSSAEVAARLAADHQILVRDLDALGLPGHLRISVGTNAQTERLANALTDVLGVERRPGRE